MARGGCSGSGSGAGEEFGSPEVMAEEIEMKRGEKLEGFRK